MTILYKLTTKDYKTRKGFSNETTWGVNVKHTAPGGADQPLCSDKWLHASRTKEEAYFLRGVYIDVSSDEHTVLWKAEGSVGREDPGKGRVH